MKIITSSQGANTICQTVNPEIREKNMEGNVNLPIPRKLWRHEWIRWNWAHWEGVWFGRVRDGGGRWRDARERTDAEALTDGSPRSHRLLASEEMETFAPMIL